MLDDTSESKKTCVVGNKESKDKVFHGQEPPSGESTNTECGVNYQRLAVMLLK